MPASQSSNHVSFISISQASRKLGVSEATLRQWTDEGKIRAFITPGGHRRYADSELRQFIGTRNRVQGIKDIVARIELAPAQEIHIAQTHFASTPWYNGLDDDSRDRLRELGKRIHQLVIVFITRQNKRDETILRAREVGAEFGTCLVKMGLSLTDSIEAFLLHRSPLITAATDLMQKRQALDERAAGAIVLVTQITDEALLSLVKAYQNHNKGDSDMDGSGLI